MSKSGMRIFCFRPFSAACGRLSAGVYRRDQRSRSNLRVRFDPPSEGLLVLNPKESYLFGFTSRTLQRGAGCMVLLCVIRLPFAL